MLDHLHGITVVRRRYRFLQGPYMHLEVASVIWCPIWFSICPEKKCLRLNNTLHGCPHVGRLYPVPPFYVPDFTHCPSPPVILLSAPHPPLCPHTFRRALTSSWNTATSAPVPRNWLSRLRISSERAGESQLMVGKC